MSTQPSSVPRYTRSARPGRNLAARIAARFDRGDDLGAYRAVLAVPGYRREAGGLALERLGEWAYTLGLTVLAYELTGGATAVAALFLVHVAPRMLILSAGPAFALRRPRLALLGGGMARALLVLALLLVSARSDLQWALLVALGLGSLGMLTDTARTSIVPTLMPRQLLPAVNMLTGRIEQACLFAGALLAAGVILMWGVEATFVLAACTMLAAVGVRARIHPAGLLPRPVQPRASGGSWAALRADTTLRLLLAALFAGALLGMSLRVLLIDIVAGRHGYSEAVYVGLLAIIGFGALAGPVPISRLLGKLSAGVAAFAIVLTLALGVALVGVLETFVLVLPVLLLCGVLAITNDLVAVTVARRLTPGGQVAGALSILTGAVVVGQIVALVAVLGLATWLNTGELLLALSAASTLIMALFWLRGPGSTAATDMVRRTVRQT